MRHIGISIYKTTTQHDKTGIRPEIANAISPHVDGYLWSGLKQKIIFPHHLRICYLELSRIVYEESD